MSAMGGKLTLARLPDNPNVRMGRKQTLALMSGMVESGYSLHLILLYYCFGLSGGRGNSTS